MFDGEGQDVKGSAAIETFVPSQSGMAPHTLQVPADAPLRVEAPRAVVNLTGGYARGGAVSVKRGLALTSDGAGLIISDEWQHTRAKTLVWRAHTAANVSVNADGRSFTLQLGGQTLTVFVLSSGGQPATLAAGAVQFAFPDTNTFKDVTGTYIIHRLTVTVPASAGQLSVQIGGSQAVKGVAPLSSWGDASVFSIEM